MVIGLNQLMHDRKIQGLLNKVATLETIRNAIIQRQKHYAASLWSKSYQSWLKKISFCNFHYCLACIMMLFGNLVPIAQQDGIDLRCFYLGVYMPWQWSSKLIEGSLANHGWVSYGLVSHDSWSAWS